MSSEKRSAHSPDPASVRAERLQSALTALKGDQEDVLGIMRSVSVALQEYRSIGLSHPLYCMWNGIKQGYSDTLRMSRSNASNYASQIWRYLHLLSYLTKPDINLSNDEKRALIVPFMRDITDASHQAVKIAKAFEDVANSIESFPGELKKHENEKNFCARLWDRVNDWCTEAVKTVCDISRTMKTIFTKKFSLTANPRISGYWKTGISPLLSSYTKHDEHDQAAHSASQQKIQDDCEDLYERVNGIADIWAEIEQSFQALTNYLRIIDERLDFAKFCSAIQEEAMGLYGPLIECLYAYASNRRPNLGVQCPL